MENPEEILHSLEEFTKFRPKDIPRELEDYLCFVAKTGDPVYQWGSIKHLLKEKLISVVNEFYESCPSVDIPPCPNVELFNYDTMKSFILEKLETFAAAPFTVQRICELLTTPRREYNRIDKFMRALEKNILVVSTIEPGCKNTENGESLVNGLESEHLPESSNCSTEINVVEMEESPVWHKSEQSEMQFQTTDDITTPEVQDTFVSETAEAEKETACTSSEDKVLAIEESPKEFDAVEDVPTNSSVDESESIDNTHCLEINVDALPAQIEDEVTSEPVASSEIPDELSESEAVCSEVSKEPEIVEDVPTDTETAIQEDLKQADSTTSSKSPQPETVPLDCELKLSPIEPNQSFEAEVVEDPTSEIASSEDKSDEVGDSSESLAVIIEPDTPNQGPAIIEDETDSNEAKELMTVESEDKCVYDEDSNASPAVVADTTKGYQEEIPIVPRIEENKDEEITSSDKVVIAVPNTSIDDISDDESEAEAEVPKESTSEVVEDLCEVPSVSEIPENDSLVSASTDELKKDCEETPMDIDLKDKSDFNEAEAVCESV